MALKNIDDLYIASIEDTMGEIRIITFYNKDKSIRIPECGIQSCNRDADYDVKKDYHSIGQFCKWHMALWYRYPDEMVTTHSKIVKE